MSGGQTKSSALDSMKALIYQTAIGLNQCFLMDNGASVWFERDGDVSVNSLDINNSIQIEVKEYSDPLTDNHENFWKTLKNLLSDDFNHNQYSSLILLTTQKFGIKSSLSNWNNQKPKERLGIVKSILSNRDKKELKNPKAGSIFDFQKKILETNDDKLESVLSKFFITTEADDISTLIEKIKKEKLIGIPITNRDSYIEGLVDFLFSAANNTANRWKISYEEFQDKCMELTSNYRLSEYSFPPFTGEEADKNCIQEHSDKMFVKKIIDIEYEEVIPDAIGNWIELHKSLKKELHNFPQYRKKTNDYQKQLVKQFTYKYSARKRKVLNIIEDSKSLFDEIIGETPAPMSNCPAPPLPYRNGLIHEAMDSDNNLKWRLE